MPPCLFNWNATTESGAGSFDSLRLCPLPHGELSHIADKTTREWIFAWLKDPRAYAASATMPNFLLKDEDARDISAFLIANSTPVRGDTIPISSVAQKSAPDPQAGASVYGESFCASCHAVQNAAGNLVGGDIGPELTRVGSKVKPEWLQAWIRNPRIYDPRTAMSHYRFNDQQADVLTGEICSRVDPHRKQAHIFTDFHSGYAAHIAGLHRQ